MQSQPRYADESTLQLVAGLAHDAKELSALRIRRWQRDLRRDRPVAALALGISVGAAAELVRPFLRKTPTGLIGMLALHAGRRFASRTVDRIVTR